MTMYRNSGRGVPIGVAATLAALLLGWPLAGPVRSADGDIVRVAVGVDATSMDPYLSTSTTDKDVVSHIFDTLLTRDQQMHVRPGLATAYKAVSPTIWEFTLRQGVKFTNGEPLTGAAIKWTMEHLQDPKLKAPSVAQFAPVERVDVVDPSTVRIVTKEPYPVLPAVMTEFWVMSPGYGRSQDQATLGQKPVGSGAYILKEWAKGDHIVLEANPAYWGGRLAIRTVEFKPVPDQNTRLALLQTGEADIVASVPPEATRRFASSPDIRIVKVAGARSYFVGLNQMVRGPLGDKRVRQALNYAVDADTIIKYTFGGNGRRLATLLTPQQFGYTERVKPAPYDQARARALLAEAGFPTGFRIDMETPDGRYPKDKEGSQVIAGQLQQVGVSVNLVVKEWGSFIGQFRTQPGPAMYYLGWSIPTFDADSILTPLLTPNQTYARFSDPELTRLLTEARMTVDANRRAALYGEASRLMQEDAPMIFLYQLDDLYGARKRVRWEPRTDERILLMAAALVR